MHTGGVSLHYRSSNCGEVGWVGGMARDARCGCAPDDVFPTTSSLHTQVSLVVHLNALQTPLQIMKSLSSQLADADLIGVTAVEDVCTI